VELDIARKKSTLKIKGGIIMKILVPIDDSSASIIAVKKAIEIAKKYDFSIKLIYVIEPGDVSSYKRNEKLWHQVDGSIISGIHESEMSLEVKSAQLLDVITEKLDFLDIKLEKEVLFGEPHVKILETAKNENFDLIVMCNRSVSKIKQLFLGSVTQKVLSESLCPVLVIHNDLDD